MADEDVKTATEQGRQDAPVEREKPASAEAEATATAGEGRRHVAEGSAGGSRRDGSGHSGGPDIRGARGRGGSGRSGSTGFAHILATFNNTLVSISDAKGGVIAWCTAGRAGFKGARKSTAFAATMVAQEAAKQAVQKGMHEVEVRVQGPGSGRESAIRALQSAGLTITAIRDTTPVPHNGCRPRKKRRV